MRLWTAGVFAALVFSLVVVGPRVAHGPSPQPMDRLIRVDNGTSVTIWEQTGTIDALTYDVSTLTGSGATYTSLANEQFTFSSDGVSVKIHCFRDGYDSGSQSGNNIAAARLDGVPGYPGGIWASIIVSYIVGYGGIESSRFNALGDNLTDHTWMGDQTSELVLGFTVPSNLPPSITSFPPVSASEGAAGLLSATASDSDGDPLQFRWDFGADGVWDTGWSPNSTASHVWGDDWTGAARVQVTDSSLNVTAETSVNILNVSPAVTNLTIGLAKPECRGDDEHGDHGGDHKHADDECGDRDNDHDHEGCGSEDGDHDNEEHDLDGEREHDDDDDHDGGSCGVTYVFNATAVDPGSDDLTFHWDFGDGTNSSHTYYNNGVSPDPHPSPGPTFPVNVTNVATHMYTTSGNFTVILNVTDDDGGIVTIVRHFLACAGGGDDEHGDHDGDHEHHDDCDGRDDHDEVDQHGCSEAYQTGDGTVDAQGSFEADSAGILGVIGSTRFVTAPRARSWGP